MKRRDTMHKMTILKPLILGFSIILATMNANAEITKQSIAAFVDEIHQASESKNINFLKSAISNNAEIVLFPSCVGTPENAINLTKKEYITMTNETFDIIENYNHNVLSLTQEISNDRKSSIINTTVYESMTIHNIDYGQKAQMRVVIREIANKIQLTQLIACIMEVSIKDAKLSQPAAEKASKKAPETLLEEYLQMQKK
jgi:hypothetical protein